MTQDRPIIDELTLADVPRCAELEMAMFAGDSPWPQSAFRTEMKAPYNTYFAARDTPGGEAMGYAGISMLGGPGAYESEIHTIAVDPERRGRGYGLALLRAMLTVADDADAPVFLEVRTDNDTAISLYERNGFTTAGIRRGYYQPSGADAYTMIRRARTETLRPEEDPR
ncbi:ribosomal protein S18-alanine N-acetyltransferase [Gordonia sp. (in: high G+C Gram-positive bacteria)]|uniref:ribosomal protein S18-alanine N-acetyltransferase n=1 Tax=Gordonia sp. (in: high G+C Gram-positive bacteria) TaxID=84139 RepID=UPI001DC1AAE8|nr:ribosomal protein S18-alanine N-acetyltransferase [Gordonia sp. (in: high G+C Gram-positive bacteria)]MCB1296468.1 ribosomal protein S18-alanine N-acetyltransferase [Gordonia sp. (in: high G+C Gram-positive bacteria)]HMS74299.1 ribosomal protein S18-alanine N-acetyltransferase [Gordonia sp. (in: high G+C Gram-positive bacteria)]HQV18363.1 ribosomal protein S18-alanine N-acetyltransferase [Gordonia sp. (in: high G+C Gram-positive bacteria)]